MGGLAGWGAVCVFWGGGEGGWGRWGRCMYAYFSAVVCVCVHRAPLLIIDTIHTRPNPPPLFKKKQDVVEVDLPGVKRLLLNLEKKVQANLLKRVKFADEPAKFLDAELELYEEIGNFKVGG